MRWIHPVKIPPGSIGQPFGAQWVDYSQFGWKGHNGQDYPAPKGTTIYAVYDGFIVEQTAKETGYGLRVSQRIDDGDKHYLAVYGHMERLEKPVNINYNWNYKGCPVKQGQVIGYVDSTGFSTGDHVHLGPYEYDIKGNKLNSNNGYGGAFDPMLFIKEPMLEIVNDNGTYYVVGNKAKLGINGEDALAFWRQLTDNERTGSTAGIPSIGIWEKTFGVDLD